MKRGGEIDGDDGIPVVVGEAHRQVVARDPGVVDHDVDAPERPDGLFHEARGGLRIGEIGPQGNRGRVVIGAQLADHGFGAVGMRRVPDRHRRSGSRKRNCRGSADAA